MRLYACLHGRTCALHDVCVRLYACVFAVCVRVYSTSNVILHALYELVGASLCMRVCLLLLYACLHARFAYTFAFRSYTGMHVACVLVVCLRLYVIFHALRAVVGALHAPVCAYMRVCMRLYVFSHALVCVFACTYTYLRFCMPCMRVVHTRFH